MTHHQQRSPATRVLQCNDLLQHVLQWCNRSDLVALACTQRALRHNLMNGHTDNMTRLWPKHMVHVQVSDAQRWDQVQASSTGRAMRHIDFSQLLLPAVNELDERDWMRGCTYPLLSLGLWRTRHTHANIKWYCKRELTEYIWYACCGDRELLSTETSCIQELQGHTNCLFVGPTATTTISRSAFVETISQSGFFKPVDTIPITDLPMDMIRRIATQWPAAQLLAHCLTTPACRSLTTVACTFEGSHVFQFLWMRLIMSLLHHLHHLRHLVMWNASHICFPLPSTLHVRRLSLAYAKSTSLSLITRSAQLACQAAHPNMAIDIACETICVSSDDVEREHESYSEACFAFIRQGRITWSCDTIVAPVHGKTAVARLCQALSEAPTPIAPVIFVRFCIEPSLLMPRDLAFVKETTHWIVYFDTMHTLGDAESVVCFEALLDQLRVDGHTFPIVIRLECRDRDGLPLDSLAQRLVYHLPHTTIVTWKQTRQLHGRLVA
jgi:hypothetical protein